MTDFDSIPLVLSVRDLCPVLDISKNTAYELIKSGEIRSIRIGRQIRIPKEALQQYLSGKE